ncbi:radical SAM protein [Flavobacterium magnum]|uniref:Radical SAM protein n=1 Tax=Flavobacterium magnum TaxID=2162713 RepID=A0A2S0RE32_9FLAO|nr:radical SAM protein [Flavobacterium magnum]AWA29508.1 radical SAM protein [Flavobacterium magnum]
MSEVLFTHSYFYRRDPKQWKNKTPFPPLGTLYAASLLRENGYTVSLFDTCLIENPMEIKPVIEALRPRYLVIFDDGFNYLTKMCLTTMREAAFDMIRLAKKNGVTVVVNSSDSTDHYGLYLEQGADYIIQGEGEFTLLELLNKLQQGDAPDDVQGLAFKNGHHTQLNPKRPVLQNLDALPMPAWDLIEMNDYKIIWNQGGQEFTLNIATTRGCPYKCNWCAKPIYGNRYNSHSPEYIVDHIEFLRQSFGVKRFWMCDDIFGLKPNWVQHFNAGLKSRKLQIRYYIQSRVDLLLKADTIDALAESGLEEVWVGAESASQKILDAMDKGTKVEQIYEATRLLKSRKVRVAFFLQFGYPGETREDIAQTIAMVRELMPDNIGISVSYPLPGTPFYDRVRSELSGKANWSDSDDLEMMFKGTFNTTYYKKLQRFVHKEFRKSQGMQNLKTIAGNPLQLSLRKIISVLKLGYYVPGAFASGLRLKKLQK